MDENPGSSRSCSSFAGWLDRLPDAAVALNPAGEVLAINGRAERLLRCSSETSRGRRISPHLLSDWQYLPGSPFTTTTIEPRGEPVSVEVSAGAAGPPPDDHVVALIRPTGHAPAQGTFGRSTSGLAASGAARTRHLAHLAHELRTPLSAIISFAQLLLEREDRPLAPEHRRHVAIMQDCGRHLLSLSDQLVELGRVGADAVRLDAEPIDMNAAVQEVHAILMPFAKAKSLDFSLSLSDWPTLVLGDRAGLRRILINLCANAIKFTDRGGVALSVSQLGGQVAVNCSDTGIGIRDEDLHRLFGEFSRLDESRSGKDGFGLGLYVSARLAKAMGGDITVASRLGTGSTFTLLMPKATGDACLRGVVRCTAGTWPAGPQKAPRSAAMPRVLESAQVPRSIDAFTI